MLTVQNQILSMFFTSLLAVIVILLIFLFNSHYCPRCYSLVGFAMRTFYVESHLRTRVTTFLPPRVWLFEYALAIRPIAK